MLGIAVSVINPMIARPIISSRRVNPRGGLEVRRTEPWSGLMRRSIAYPVPPFRRLFAALEVQVCVEDDVCCSQCPRPVTRILDGISREQSANEWADRLRGKRVKLRSFFADGGGEGGSLTMFRR